jgi:hypothetical protein
MISQFQPHLHPKGCPSADNLEVGQIAISINSLVMSLAKDKTWHPTYIKDFTLYSYNVLMMNFRAVVTLLMEETNWYYQKYFDLMMDLLH